MWHGQNCDSSQMRTKRVGAWPLCFFFIVPYIFDVFNFSFAKSRRNKIFVWWCHTNTHGTNLRSSPQLKEPKYLRKLKVSPKKVLRLAPPGPPPQLRAGGGWKEGGALVGKRVHQAAGAGSVAKRGHWAAPTAQLPPSKSRKRIRNTSAFNVTSSDWYYPIQKH